MKIKLQPTFKSVHGVMDDVLYRQVGDQLIMQGAPRRRTRPWSPAQIEGRRRFAEAVSYAQSVLADPYQREMYEELARERGRRADKLVTSDYLTPPEVRRIDVSAYRGQPGDVIRVIAVDDIELVSVQVKLVTATGVVIEEGPARKVHGVWLYTATAPAPAGERNTITATAQDRPGNTTMGTAVC